MQQLTSSSKRRRRGQWPWRQRDSSLPLAEEQIAARLAARGEGQESYRMALPAEPLGKLHRFGDGAGPGVQVFAVSMLPNLVGLPFIGRHEASGWPRMLTSIRVRAGDQELAGGRVDRRALRERMRGVHGGHGS